MSLMKIKTTKIRVGRKFSIHAEVYSDGDIVLSQYVGGSYMMNSTVILKKAGIKKLQKVLKEVL
jgi:hypothetical protein